MPNSDAKTKRPWAANTENAPLIALADPLLTVREGSALLDVAVPTFWRWVAKGILPKPVKLGGFSRWPQSEIVAFIEAAKAQRDASQ